MARTPRPRSRRQRIALASAAFLVALLCAAGDVRLRWTGVRRDALWAGGIVAYGALLEGARGRAVDRRGGDPATDGMPGGATVFRRKAGK